VAVKAKGSISENGGPIVIDAGGIKLLQLSDTTGKKGPSGCVDTKASGFCPGSSTYFYLNGKGDLLGLVGFSVNANAAKDGFAFDVAVGASSVFSEHLSCEFYPKQGDFAAASSMNVDLPDIHIDLGGPVKFTIPLPKASLCVALGTTVPTTAPCSDMTKPDSAPYFQFHLQVTWGAFEVDIGFTLTLQEVEKVFEDFVGFLVNKVVDWFVKKLKEAAEWLVKALYQIGKEIAEVAEWVAHVFVMAIEEAWKVVSDIWDDLLKACGVEAGNNALPSNTDAPMSELDIDGLPRVLADLTETSRGQVLLYHYYLNRSELARRLRSDSDHRRALTAAFAAPSHVEKFNRTVEVIGKLADSGSDQLKASAAEIVSLASDKKHDSYQEFLACLRD
jgi:hypothetical protein